MNQARLSELYDRLVEVAIPVIKEYQVTEDDLHVAAAFFNRLGREGVFPSLLDIAFAMSIVNRRSYDDATPGNLEGPEYRPNAPVRPDGDLLEHPVGAEVPRLRISGVVYDRRTGAVLPGAEIDIWHADEKGIYDRTGYHLRGVIVTDDQGRYTATTIVPFDYPEHEHDAVGELLTLIGKGIYRPAHVHVKVRVDTVHCLTTQLFSPESERLTTDYVVGAVNPRLVLKFDKSTDAATGIVTYAACFNFYIDRPAVTAS